jgi:predicted Zn finger-like uncharacterized protein
MSLATRCPACGTVFRVVQDQLKVSEGWVRCGHCQEVFNALESLFDLDHESPPEFGAAQEARDFADTHSPADFPEDPPEKPPLPPSDPGVEHAPFAGPAGAAQDATAGDPAETTAFRASAFGTSASVEPSFETSPPYQALEPDEPPQDEPPPAPSFVRAAERAERWQRPGVRVLLGLMVLALGGLLAAQVALHFRDRFAARWPESRPALEALCQAAGCEIHPLRNLSALSVEASSLSPEGRADTFLLTLTLRNRDQVELALPSVDVSLTDVRGTLLARRALGPGDFRRVADGAALDATLPPGAEWQVHAALTVAGQATSGYTVELFYP